MHSANPALTSIALIVVNLAVWVAIRTDDALIDKLALLPQTTLFGNQDGSATLVEGVSGGAWWQLGTSVFSHVEVWHIAFNMLALYFLGPQLEAILGRARFLGVYLLSGLAGSTAVLWLSHEHGQTLGASGAIFGLMGALLVVGLKIRANVQQLLFWIGLNVVFTVTASSFISWQGHFGGLVGGALLAALVVYAPRRRRAAVQWAGMAGFAALLVVLCAVRVAALS
jgi:membrane associated rhomboid family serine protease